MCLRPIIVHLSFYLLSVWFSGPGEFNLNVFLQLDEAVSVSFFLLLLLLLSAVYSHKKHNKGFYFSDDYFCFVSLWL